MDKAQVNGIKAITNAVIKDKRKGSTIFGTLFHIPKNNFVLLLDVLLWSLFLAIIIDIIRNDTSFEGMDIITFTIFFIIVVYIHGLILWLIFEFIRLCSSELNTTFKENLQDYRRTELERYIINKKLVN
jgi:hypothetical protein